MSLQADVEAVRIKARQSIEFLNNLMFQRAKSWLGWYLLLLLLAVLALQLVHPIIMSDTDMWYHLSGGRLLWEQGKLPDYPYFSFAYPDHKWIAYFWGFQALIYPVFEGFGYQGLIVARALLFTACAGLVFLFLYRSNHRSVSWAVVILAIVYLILLEPRSYQLRPHLVSYTMIVLFLYILEHRRSWLPALPVLTVIWGNLHGVEWVIGATVTGAYFIEQALRLKTDPDKVSKGSLLWLLACLPALLINPFGWHILMAPFAIPGGLGPLIQELQPLPPLLFFSVDIRATSLGITTASTALMLLTLSAIVYGLLNRKLRTSHVLMAVAGLALLPRGSRFIIEWALLSLPLATQVLDQLQQAAPRFRTSIVAPIVAAVLLFTPLQGFWLHIPKPITKYPFNDAGLPSGMVHFMSTHHAKGNLLIAPTFGGYINWALYPDILIHSDMEFPPFDATALLASLYALTGNKEVLHELVSRYHIDFVATNLNTNIDTVLTKDFGYKPIFFDDDFVLYANPERQKALVQADSIEYLNPNNLLDNKGSVDQQLKELEKIRLEWPQGRRVNHALTYILWKEKRYTEAAMAAERFIHIHPEDPNSYFLAGRIEESQDRFAQAIRHYETAMDYADANSKAMIMRHIGSCHYLAKDFSEAYDAFKASESPLTWSSDPEMTYQFAYSSVVTGDIAGARRLLKALLMVTPDSKTEILHDTHALLAKIDSGDLAAPGILDFLGSLFASKTTQSSNP